MSVDNCIRRSSAFGELYGPFQYQWCIPSDFNPCTEEGGPYQFQFTLDDPDESCDFITGEILKIVPICKE